MNQWRTFIKYNQRGKDKREKREKNETENRLKFSIWFPQLVRLSSIMLNMTNKWMEFDVISNRKTLSTNGMFLYFLHSKWKLSLFLSSHEMIMRFTCSIETIARHVSCFLSINRKTVYHWADDGKNWLRLLDQNRQGKIESFFSQLSFVGFHRVAKNDDRFFWRDHRK